MREMEKYAKICGKLKKMQNMREIGKNAIFCIKMRLRFSKVLNYAYFINLFLNMFAAVFLFLFNSMSKR